MCTFNPIEWLRKRYHRLASACALQEHQSWHAVAVGAGHMHAWCGLTSVKYSATSGGLTAPKGRNSMQNTNRPYTSSPQAVGGAQTQGWSSARRHSASNRPSISKSNSNTRLAAGHPICYLFTVHLVETSARSATSLALWQQGHACNARSLMQGLRVLAASAHTYKLDSGASTSVTSGGGGTHLLLAVGR
jgi:hypothetical protein